MMASVLIADSLLTSLLIVSRDLTAKTPGPEITIRALLTPASRVLSANWL